MAVYAAHLTRTLSGTPTVFQVAAQEALGNTVKPALRKLVEYLAAVYPHKCSWLVAWYDEIYLALDCCLQYHYLKHYAASFSESFYGLVRAPTRAGGEFSAGPRLGAGAERGSLALLAGLPYLRDKCERAALRWRQRDEDCQLGKSFDDKLRRAAYKLYSIMHLVCETLRLVQLAAYVSGRARSPTLSLAALGLTLKDAPPHEPDEDTWSDLMSSLAAGKLRRAAAGVSFPLVGGALLSGVQHGAFLVQLLRWWEASAVHSDALPPPPPPQRDGRAVGSMNSCPLCRRPWRAPAALPASGLLYCYACIARHVRAHGACPVTNVPAAEAQLVRVYVTP